MAATPVLAAPLAGVVVASPNTFLRQQIVETLHQGHWPVEEALGGAEALGKLASGACQMLLLDRRLPDLDADELLHIVHSRFPGVTVSLLDPDSGRPLAPRGPQPARAPLLWQALEGMLATAESRPQSPSPPPRPQPPSLPQSHPLPGMVGRSEAMLQVYRLVRLVAPRMTTILLNGPTGTGKELVAQAVHRLSPRSARPFVVINCAAIPEALLESELFGHVRGAFTGAVQSHIGRIHTAQGGTLFLDEVGELPLGLQAKLLRFLDQREVQRLGSADVFRVDVRIIVATNANLARRVGEGRFREDLYYRLSAYPVELPSLAERRADIPALAEHFLAQLARQNNSPLLGLSEEALRMLQAHSWAGNVRELQNVMERASILTEGRGPIAPEHLSFPPTCRGRRGAEAAAPAPV